MPSFSEGLLRGVQTSFALMDRKRQLAAEAEERDMRKREFEQLVKLRTQQLEGALLSNRATRQRLAQENELFPLRKRGAKLGLRQTELGIAREERQAEQDKTLFPLQTRRARLGLDREEQLTPIQIDAAKLQLEGAQRTAGLLDESDEAFNDLVRQYTAVSHITHDVSTGMKDGRTNDDDLVMFVNGLERLSGRAGQRSPVNGVTVIPVEEPQTAAGMQTGGQVPGMMVAAHLRRENGQSEYMQAEPRLVMEQAAALKTASMRVAVAQAKLGNPKLLESLLIADAKDLPDRAAVVEYYRGRGYSAEEADRKAGALYGHGPDGKGAKDTVNIREIEYIRTKLDLPDTPEGNRQAMKIQRKMRSKDTDDLKLAIDLGKVSREYKDPDKALAKVRELRAQLRADENGNGQPAAPAGPAPAPAGPAQPAATYLGEAVPPSMSATSLTNWQRQRERRVKSRVRSEARINKQDHPNPVPWSGKDSVAAAFSADEWLVARSKDDYVILINKRTGEASVPQKTGG